MSSVVSSVPASQPPIRFNIATSSTTSSTTSIPANAIATSVAVNVTTAYSAGALLQLGQTGSTSLLLDAGKVNLQVVGLQYIAVDASWGSSALAVLATLLGSPSAGACTITVHFAPAVSS